MAAAERGLTVLIINLDSRLQAQISLALPRAPQQPQPQPRGEGSDTVVQAQQYLLSGPGGTNASAIALNGVLLELIRTGAGAANASWALPKMAARTLTLEMSGAGLVQMPPMPPTTIMFVTLAGLGNQVGCPVHPAGPSTPNHLPVKTDDEAPTARNRSPPSHTFTSPDGKLVAQAYLPGHGAFYQGTRFEQPMVHSLVLRGGGGNGRGAKPLAHNFYGVSISTQRHSDVESSL